MTPIDRLRAHPFTPFCVGLAAYAVATLALVFAWQASERSNAADRLERFGRTIAQTLAAQAAEPVLTRDRIGLGVAANRILGLPEVAGIGVYTIDDAPIAIVGNAADGPDLVAFTAAVTVDDTIAAYVRVALFRAAFRTTIGAVPLRAWAWWLGGFLATAALGLACSPGAARLTRGSGDRATGVGPADASDAAEPGLTSPAQPGHVYVLVVNLFNQISLPPEQKTVALDGALTRAAQIANLYAGRTELLSGTGLLMAFDDTRAEERGFEVVCAALLTSRVLADLNHAHFQNARPELVFRYSLHRAPFRAEQSTLKEAEEVRDAVMLSAMAPDGNIAVSAEVFDGLARPGRLSMAVVSHPALAALATTGDTCHIVTAVADSYQALLDRQAELLGV